MSAGRAPARTCGRRLLLWGALALAAPTLAACDLTMYRQPKYHPESPAAALPGDMEAQDPPAGTVAQGRMGALAASAAPPAVDAALLRRGRERFEIYCTPCHGRSGAGDGTVVARGFPPPPDYASPQVRALTGAQIFGVITNGYGIMFPYGDRVAPRDRWAIVAYVRALQIARSEGLAPTAPPAGAWGRFR